MIVANAYDGLPEYGTYGHLSGPDVLGRVDDLLDPRRPALHGRPLPEAANAC